MDRIRLPGKASFEKLLSDIVANQVGKEFERPMYRDTPIGAGDLLGVGPNLAFRREAIGGFDERLGPGTALKAGDDVDVVERSLRNGGVVVYEPAQLLANVAGSLRRWDSA